MEGGEWEWGEGETSFLLSPLSKSQSKKQAWNKKLKFFIPDTLKPEDEIPEPKPKNLNTKLIKQSQSERNLTLLCFDWAKAEIDLLQISMR